MKIIAHRGNLHGPDPKTENRPEQIFAAIHCGFDVEADFWYYPKIGIVIGHFVGLPISEHYANIFEMAAGSLWCHWKNKSGYYCGILTIPNVRHFMHDMEAYTKVSDGSIWLYPGTPITDNMLTAPAIVACMPELAPDWDISKATHICTDYPVKYREKYLRSVSQ